jgi:Fe-S oxidoreductase
MGIFGFGKSENLYFPGCYSYAFAQNKIENYKKILKKLKIEFKTSKDEDCCGGFLDEAGYEKEQRTLAKENNKDFISNGNKKIITNCPLCCNTLKNYSSLIPDFSLQVEFIIKTIYDVLKDNKNLVKNFFSDSIAYYDSCYLGRYLNIAQEPREILNILGYRVIELKYNKEETLCCGSCGGLFETNPELSEKISLNFITMLKRKGIKKIVTADIRAYVLLKKLIQKLDINDLEIIEFSDIICDGLGIKKEE